VNRKKLAYRVVRKIKSFLGDKITDDFDWKTYTTHYRGELEEILKSHTQILKDGDYRFKDDRLTKSNFNIDDLHPNHRLLYETIVQLKPSSVLELGCGGGDHLHNLGVLLPGLRRTGLDLSDAQLTFLRERHPGMKAELRQFDCTQPFPSDLQKVDIAYTQAVIMHIKTGNGHLAALQNLFSVATKQIVMIENWKSHDFLGDIKKLFDQGKLSWKEIHFYYRDSEELKKPHLMIVSSVPLSSYKTLSDYKILADNV